MKYQLLASVLICSIASLPSAPNNLNSPYNGETLDLGDGFDNFDNFDNFDSFGSSMEDPYSDFGSPSQYDQESLYEQNDLNYEDSIDGAPTANQGPQVDTNEELANLFQQIESLNSLIEDGGDNLDTLGAIKSTAKGIWKGAQKFYRSPAGQVTREVIKTII
jgi:hypothetical protein